MSWVTGPKSISLVNINDTIPLYSFGIPDIASLNINATFGVQASIKYDVGLGLDTNGFWIKAGSQSDPTLALSFSATAGLQGTLSVFGFNIAQAGGNVGFSIQPYDLHHGPALRHHPGPRLHEPVGAVRIEPPAGFSGFLELRHPGRL